MKSSQKILNYQKECYRTRELPRAKAPWLQKTEKYQIIVIVVGN